jgi:16S rRNA processing protein RimM
MTGRRSGDEGTGAVTVTVGRIARAHGIRGEVVVDVRTDSAEERFAPGTALATVPTSAGPLTIERARWHSGRLLVTFAGVRDRDVAEGLRGVRLEVELDADADTGDPEEFFDHQLIGLRAETVDGDVIGPISDVVHLPGQELLTVDGPGGEVLIPFVTAIVPTVDLAGGRVIVDPPPGLLDDTEAIEARADVADAGGDQS